MWTTGPASSAATARWGKGFQGGTLAAHAVTTDFADLPTDKAVHLLQARFVLSHVFMIHASLGDGTALAADSIMSKENQPKAFLCVRPQKQEAHTESPSSPALTMPPEIYEGFVSRHDACS